MITAVITTTWTSLGIILGHGLIALGKTIIKISKNILNKGQEKENHKPFSI